MSLEHGVTIERVRDLYLAELEKSRSQARKHGELTEREACLRATRTIVYAALELELGQRPRSIDESPEDCHARQKAHSIALWKEADRLIAEANL